MSGTRTRLWIQGLLLLPSSLLDAVSVEVVHSIVAIISSEDVDAAAMHDCSVAITRRWRLGAAIRIELAPCVRAEIEAKEVITSIAPVVAAKDVEVVIQGD